MGRKMRLINAYKLVIDLARANKQGRLEFDDVLAVIASEKTVEAVEEVRGRWESGHCTNCGHYGEVQNIGFTCTGEIKVNYKQTNYCPNCGAKMD